MARMIPPSVTSHTVSPGEIHVFEILKNSSETKDWVVLHSLDIARHVSQVSGEADFIVFVPNLGVLCLEVKACQSLTRSDGAWFYGVNPSPDYRGPFKQSEGARHSIYTFLTDKLGSNLDAPFFSAVAFTHIHFHETSPEWHAWQAIDKSKIDRDGIPLCIINALKSGRKHFQETSSGSWLKKNPNVPELSTINKLVKLLRPEFEYFESPRSRKTRALDETKKYTEEQFDALDIAELNDRVAYNGLAGTGKSFLAIETARRAAEVNKRVLFLCYNEMLSLYLKEQLRPLNQVYCSTISSFMLDIAAISPEEGNHFWDYKLPALAKKSIQESHMFDVLILDEAQDFMSMELIDFLDNVIKGGWNKGKILLFGDFDAQSVQKTDIKLQDLKNVCASDLVLFTLNKNCRNTPRVACLGEGFTNGLVKYRSILRQDDGVEPEIVIYSTQEEQFEHLLKTLSKYKIAGIELDEIAVLSCKANNSAVKELADTFSASSSPVNFRGILANGLVCTTIRRFKGLERYGVIVTDIDDFEQKSLTELLYIASTRTIGRLTLLVHKDVIGNLTVKALPHAA